MTHSTAATFYTIGHSNRPLDRFLELLQANGIRVVLDVRRFPGSRKFPHFQQAALAEALRAAGITYRHVPELGGRRSARQPNSPNQAWRVAGFNAYADHLHQPEIQALLRRVVEQLRHTPTAFLCAEAVPWRCHRQLIADQLLAWGHRVLHIIDRDQVREHKLPPFARVEPDGRVVYPATPSTPLLAAQHEASGPVAPRDDQPRTEAECCPSEASTTADEEPKASADSSGLDVRPEWPPLAQRLRGSTTLVIGRVNTGKSTLVRWLWEALVREGARVGVVTCDVGQPLFGPPGAMWAGTSPAEPPCFGWFVGDNSPTGNLVPVLVGAGALVERLRQSGCDTILVDTTGLVDGPIGRLLKLHKAIVTRAQHAVFVGPDTSTQTIADLVHTCGIQCHQIPKSDEVRERDWEERRAFRQSRFEAYFRHAGLILVPNDAVITPQWEVGLTAATAAIAPGCLCGLLDQRFFCVGLGIIESLAPRGVFVRTPVPEGTFQVVAIGRIKLDRSGRELGKLGR